MEKVSVDDGESDPIEGGVNRRRLSEPLGTTAVAINCYDSRLAKGFQEDFTLTEIKRKCSS